MVDFTHLYTCLLHKEFTTEAVYHENSEENESLFCLKYVDFILRDIVVFFKVGLRMKAMQIAEK